MASPRALIQLALASSRIVGKAFAEAGRQAVKNAKHSPQAAMGNDVAGVGHATGNATTDQITREHRMTLDEAQLILNIKREAGMESITKHYEHLFTVNSPQPPPENPTPNARNQQPIYSHYLQSKVVCARERLLAELASEEAPPAEPPSPPPPAADGSQS